MPTQAKIWRNRFPILDESHADDLEARAAVHEFKGRHPTDIAEEKAHADYVRDRALDNASHHLVGIRAAHAAGHDEAARQHGAAYHAAMTAAGHDPTKAPPPEVTDRLKTARPNVYSFKAHEGDELFAPKQQEADEGDAHIRTLLDNLQALRGRIAPAKKPD